jgi:medium-chain acyl-[acyl-carrier-protein] hydrolase
MHKVKLFCLPYAGASASVYSKWRRRLFPTVEIRPLELSGRGARSNESLPASVEEAVEDLFRQMAGELDDSPYAVFGHSMGSLLAYELVHRIRRASLPEPGTLFVSGRSAPHIPAGDRRVHLMSDAEFREELIRIGGTPKELFDTPPLYRLFERIIRSDYRMIETYRYKEKPQRIGSTMIVLNGTHDRTTLGRMEEWENHAAAACRIVNFHGGHFFIHECEDEIFELINHELTAGMPKGAGIF